VRLPAIDTYKSGNCHNYSCTYEAARKGTENSSHVAHSPSSYIASLGLFLAA
jgi:hypothetical protein